MLGKIFNAVFKQGTIGECNINGAQFSGNNITITQDQIIIDGMVIRGNDFGTTLNVSLTGSCESLNTSSGSVNVTGNAGSVGTTSGDIKCGNVSGKVSTTSGDVECENVYGDVSTVSGDVECDDISGSVRTVSGDITSGK